MSASTGGELVAKITQSINEVPAEQWDACEGDGNPFLSHAFLSALEDSECVNRRTGWGPVHLILEDEAGLLQSCVPLYMKSHSRGEYIFDHGWADAYERAGGRYYPKLLAAVPFVPATGRRLLVRRGPEADAVEAQTINALKAVSQQLEIATVSVNFCLEEEWEHLADAGFLKRTDQQFHWYNRGYTDFEGFLDDLSSRKRKNIRRERAGALENDIEIEILQGSDLTEDHWDAFYGFYLDTGGRKWGTPYLNRTFFSLINERMPEKIVLIMCKRQGRYIAGALNFVGPDCIYGRHWGCVEDHRFLHFEACYYQAIDYAIAHGLARVEAGAQGPHKLARGYQPTRIHSAHYIRDEGFRRAVADYLEHERREVEHDMSYLEDRTPFRKGERLSLD
tara:strand:+ start:32 stop:1210 length:1179 start_codon:yes stop_codon:yes gene_type:complete